MKLHEDQDTFAEAIEATAQALAIPDAFVEKDYWVIFLLKNLSESPFKERVVFKGGTSLSKAHKIINRFSEDVDLALLKEDGISQNQNKESLSTIEKLCAIAPLQPDNVFIGTKGNKIRRTSWIYPSTAKKPAPGILSRRLLLEINAFTHPIPSHQKSVQSFVGEHLIQIDPKFAHEQGLIAFEVLVLDIERTFVEKLLSLCRISIIDLPTFPQSGMKIRHLYDLLKISDQPGFGEFLESERFPELLEIAKKDDLTHTDFKSDWGDYRVVDTPFFVQSAEYLHAVQSAFEIDLASLLYGTERVQFKAVSPFVDRLKKRMSQFEF
jgi:hypothetical protein